MNTIQNPNLNEASTSQNMDVVGGPQNTPLNSTSQETGVAPRFLVVKRVEGDFAQVNPFIIEKQMYSLVGTAKNIRKIKDGILVETASASQSRRLMNVRMFGEYPVEVLPHQSLNTSKGVLHCPDLLNCSIDDILEGLKEQGVIGVRRIKIRKEGNLIDSANHVLTFNTPVLPKRIKAAFYSLQVRLYVPAPMRCFRCQKFGHTSMRCEEQQVCVCGKPLHQGKPCEEPLICVNCSGSHSARSRNCPKYKVEAAIQEVKATENISYFEAKKKVVPKTPNPNITYAAATAAPPKTDYTPLIEQLIPKLIEVLSAYNSDIEPKKRRLQSSERQEATSEDEASLSSQVSLSSQARSSKSKPGWPKGKPRKKKRTM